LPHQFGSWKFFREDVVDQETQDVLKADDLIYRYYVDRAQSRTAVSLFVAAFRSQRNGKSPRSPKNCLPGSGWTQLTSGVYPIRLESGQSIEVNLYIVGHGERNQMGSDGFFSSAWDGTLAFLMGPAPGIRRPHPLPRLVRA
jgi:EpsI family protein